MQKLKLRKRPTFVSYLILTFFLISVITSCSTDDGIPDEESVENASKDVPCANATDLVFNEKDGLLVVEFENTEFPDNWKLKNGGNGFSGKGFMVWQGEQYFSQPGNGAATFKIRIKNSGQYRFLWNSAVKSGNNGTEHNDTWLRFANAKNFYAQKGDSRVFPKGSGKTPNPEGASKDGWFKIYRGGNDLGFKWQALTYDNNGHEVFVVFDKPGIYEMEVSARSSGHAIDKFVLFNSSHTLESATSSDELSATSCN
ncbi:hypothetical protein [Maribacter sp.]